jgi:nucleotide-binding universal stress UspA family protein
MHQRGGPRAPWPATHPEELFNRIRVSDRPEAHRSHRETLSHPLYTKAARWPLLSVLADYNTFLLTEVALAGALVQMEDDLKDILNEGVARLRKLGFDPVAKLVRGQPAEEIGNFARQIEADLIVVGNQRQSAFDRWWSGPKGAYLMDYTDCSLLVARNAVSDEAIEAAFMTSGQTNG